MTKERLETMASKGFKYIYAALRAGTTGSETTIDQATLDFIDTVGKGGAVVGCPHGHDYVSVGDKIDVTSNANDKARGCRC